MERYADETVKVIDWDEPPEQRFLLPHRSGSRATLQRRADLVGFVNGLPLVFVELKAA